MDIDELIYKYLMGELNLKEQHELHKQLEDNGISPEALKKIELFWNEPKDKFQQAEDEVYQDIFKKINNEQREEVRYMTFIRKRRSAIRNISVAASVLLLISMVFFLHDFGGKVEANEAAPVIEHRKTASGQKLQVYLRDGSKVKLNAESSIEFSKYFTDSTRIVSLKGEAFFEVAEDPNRPFLVVVGGVVVKALGTSFNIRNEKDKTMVFLTSGSVSVTSSKKGDKIVLMPGEMVSEANGQMGGISFFEYGDIAWKDNILIFQEAGSHQVLNELEKWYGVDIHTNGDLGKWSFSGQFENEPLKEVLLGIGHSEEFEFEIQNKEVVIKKMKRMNK